jgi:hypothetical protein
MSRTAVSALEAFPEGVCVLSDDELVQYACLALAFKAPLLERHVDRSSYTAAADAQCARFVEPDVSIRRQDWNCQRRALRHLALQLKAPDKAPAAPEDIVKI